MINKIGDPYFDLMDEEMALAFSIYCGVCITHSVVYQKIQEAHIRNALANELVMYHMKVIYHIVKFNQEKLNILVDTAFQTNKIDYRTDILIEFDLRSFERIYCDNP